MFSWTKMLRRTFAAFALLAAARSVVAAEVGHYLPGVFNIRDWAAPPKKGLYYVQYNVLYRSTDLKDGNGTSISNINIGNTPLNIDPKVNIFLFVPTVVWNTGFTVLGADFVMLAAPTFGTTSIGGFLNGLYKSREFGRKQWGVGDLFVQPVRLGWHGTHYDISGGYAFWAPVGTYTAGAPDNIGLGFWSNQVMATGIYYPKADKSSALMLTGIYEFNSKQSGIDDTPGSHFGLEYGFSQYLSTRFEVGIAGFYLKQVTDDKGADARTPTVHNRTNGVGPEATLWLVPNKFSVIGRVIWDYGVRARFNGTTANITLAYVF
jgi:hypothetical protein